MSTITREFTKEQKTHHLKIYHEHFSAVLTGVKRAELRKNDRDYKVGDTLHLMETPKGSCSPTGEFVNAVVTHIADVGDWLPGYVLLSIEREKGHTAPPAPASVPTFDEWLEIRGNKPLGWVKDAMRESYNACRAAMLQGAEPVTMAYKLPEPIKDNRLNSGVEADDYYSGYQAGWNELLEAVSGNSPVIPEGWALVPVDLTCEMDDAAWEAYHDTRCMSDIWAALLEAASQQEVK